MYLGDFHVHSNFSDGQLSIPELVDLYGSRGFGALAITDHICERETLLGRAAKYLDKTLTEESFPAYIEQMHEEAERAWHSYKMVLIPGFELTKNTIINHRSAHIVALGVHEYIDSSQDVVQLIDEIHAQGALAIAAHPVFTRKVEPQTLHLWGRKEELQDKFDAWEVASGPHLFDEVLESGFPMIANTDLHRPEQLKAWKTEFDCERHPGAILESIKKQRISFKFFNA